MLTYVDPVEEEISKSDQSIRAKNNTRRISLREIPLNSFFTFRPLSPPHSYSTTFRTVPFLTQFKSHWSRCVIFSAASFSSLCRQANTQSKANLQMINLTTVAKLLFTDVYYKHDTLTRLLLHCRINCFCNERSSGFYFSNFTDLVRFFFVLSLLHVIKVVSLRTIYAFSDPRSL